MTATYIGVSNDDLKNGSTYNVTVAKFSGKKYQPGFKIVDGRVNWNDKIGEPDNRFMIYGGVPYKVYESAADVLKDFKPLNDNDADFQLLNHFIKKSKVSA